jgi:hypothetical protein
MERGTDWRVIKVKVLHVLWSREVEISKANRSEVIELMLEIPTSGLWIPPD